MIQFIRMLLCRHVNFEGMGVSFKGKRHGYCHDCGYFVGKRDSQGK